MGKAVFQTEIIELGEQVDAFFEEGMFVLIWRQCTGYIKRFLSFHRSEEGGWNNQKRR